MTTTLQFTMSAMLSSARDSVPCLPALACISAVMPVKRVGLLSGKTDASASGAVATKPITAVDDVVSVRKASEISVTLTPWRYSSVIILALWFLLVK